MVVELISKVLNASRGFCWAFCCSVQSPGWSCLPAVPNGDCSSLLGKDAVPGDCNVCSVTLLELSLMWLCPGPTSVFYSSDFGYGLDVGPNGQNHCAQQAVWMQPAWLIGGWESLVVWPESTSSPRISSLPLPFSWVWLCISVQGSILLWWDRPVFRILQ